MRSHNPPSGFGSTRVEPFESRQQAALLHNLTDEELVDRCQFYGIKIALPYSQLESDAIQHGVSVDTVLRDYLISKLEEVVES